MLIYIIDAMVLLSSCLLVVHTILDGMGKLGLKTYEVIGSKLTKKRYNFIKKYPTNVKEMIYTKKIDGIGYITLDRFTSIVEYDYDCILVDYVRDPIFRNIRKRNKKKLSFVYYIKLTDEFKKYTEKHKIRYNIEVFSYNKVISHDSTGPNFKYEILFSMDSKFYPKMKLFDLIS